MFRPAADKPVLLIVAGPNGSGKSSAYDKTDIEWNGRSIWIVNPDLLAARIRDVEDMPALDANLQAVIRIESWLRASVAVHKTIGVETVLSSDKYRSLVLAAQGLGFEVWLLFVVLDTPERNVERVRLRVKKGGHDVPEDKIRARYERSLAQFPWFLDRADRAWIYDNSGARPHLIGEKKEGVITLDQDALAIVVTAVRTLQDD